MDLNLSRQELMDIGKELGALMSDSGPTVFGVFEDEKKILFAKEKILEKIDNVYM